MLRVIIVLTVLLFGVALAAQYPQFIEHYYANGLFVYLSGLLRMLFNKVPFSIGDFLYTFLIAGLLYGFFRLLKALLNRNFRQAGQVIVKGIIAVQAIILSFYILWGMNYFRQPGYQILNLPDTAFTATDVHRVAAMLIDSLNQTRSQFNNNASTSSDSYIFSQSSIAINQLATKQFRIMGWRPGVKPSLYTPLLNYMGTSGYNNPFTGEAQLNTRMPAFDRPATACHEMAHQLGFAREDEANFIGFLAAIQSQQPSIRYSGYYLAAQEFLQYMHRRDSADYKRLRYRLSASVVSDFKTDSAYWAHYQGQVEQITGRFYGAFLKANNQPAGLHTYNRMIILTLAWYKKREKVAFKGNTWVK
ncbi:DUF3810 domain-containing protein [Mucilaginibacter sp.]